NSNNEKNTTLYKVLLFFISCIILLGQLFFFLCSCRTMRSVRCPGPHTTESVVQTFRIAAAAAMPSRCFRLGKIQWKCRCILLFLKVIFAPVVAR
ncbi:MAG: hypothetical protein Q8787_02840, partial [Sweet potato little leaf phytoplasma]|nr:hypothetical protein [Sweet potato little leaf phytoplasma]